MYNLWGKKTSKKKTGNCCIFFACYVHSKFEQKPKKITGSWFKQRITKFNDYYAFFYEFRSKEQKEILLHSKKSVTIESR